VITHFAIPVEVILSRHRELVVEHQSCGFKTDAVIALVAGVIGFVPRIHLDTIV
jgi:hypothetical protein